MGDIAQIGQNGAARQRRDRGNGAVTATFGGGVTGVMLLLLSSMFRIGVGGS